MYLIVIALILTGCLFEKKEHACLDSSSSDLGKIAVTRLNVGPPGLPLATAGAYSDITYFDSLGNKIATGQQEDVIGEARRNPIHISFIYSPVIGIDNVSWQSPDQTWIPPMYMRPDGTIDESEQAACEESSFTVPEDEMLWPVNPNCLSLVQVFTDSAYTARISIYDQTGTLVHSSVQRFGRCGELYNYLRYRSEGLVSWLVWNVRDFDGNFVGTGVYKWEVEFITSAGVRSQTYKQGIACLELEPAANCALN
jgi:hypothetical protein